MEKLEKKKFDYIFKMVLVGDLAVGKTCILNRLKYDEFNKKEISTIGVDSANKTFFTKNK